MKRIAIYGKGGIGKSTIAVSLCRIFAAQKKKVLLFGCDPKHDTSMKVVKRFPVKTAMEALLVEGERDLELEHFLMRGDSGIDCIEVGGPEPGVGCGGRGITKTFELLARFGFDYSAYDVVVFDVLGDVVCGGFAAPMQSCHADEVYVVVSGETMALYAANNICRAVRRFSKTGLALGGLIGNSRAARGEPAILTRFARRIRARLLTVIPRSAAVQEAERRGLNVIEYAPKSAAALRLRRLAAAIAGTAARDCPPVMPMGDVEFHEFVNSTLFR